jgi:hypothetical protein
MGFNETMEVCMKLYLLTRTDKFEWEVYNEFVIRAESDIEARQLANTIDHYDTNDSWLNPDYSDCDLIETEGETEIIASDYHSG